MRLVQIALLAGLLASVTGCSANHHSIFRQSVIPNSGASVLTVDAKQRIVLSSFFPAVVAITGNVDAGTSSRAATPAQQRFCAEPSPDVYSVMAQALSGGGSFGQSADPASVEAAVNAAFSSAEQGSTIPRTQTVNMLRELMYRTCERYLSAGYDSTELSVQAIRDQRLMVSILAIEQLTGAVTPRPVVISATGSGAAGATGEAVVRVDDARKARDAAASTARTAEAAYEQVNGTDKVCDTIKDKPAAELTDAQKLKVDPCSRARETRATAQAARTETARAYEELGVLARGGGVNVATDVAATAPGGLDTARSGDVAAVSDVVRSIVTSNLSDSSEIMMFCLRVLRDDREGRGALSTSLRDRCVVFLEESVLTASARLAAEQRIVFEIEASQRGIADASTSAFSRFWTDERAGEMRQAEGRNRLVEKLRNRLPTREAQKATCFRNAGDIDAARICFNALDTATQRDPSWQTIED